MSRIALLFLSPLFTLQVWAQNPTPNDLFQNGLAAYQNKRYDEARAHFEKLVTLRPTDTHVIHNLALSYFQVEQRPLAMAHWRKALSIDPGYRPAQISKDYLEQRMNMRPFERDPFQLWLLESLAGVSLFEATWFVAFLLVAGGYFWVRYVSARVAAVEDEQPMPPFPATAVGLTVFFTLAVVLVGLKLKHLSLTRATVIAIKTSARSLPAEDSVPVFDLNGGSEILVRRQDGGWAQVQSSDGSSGWLKASDFLVTSGG